MIDVVSRRRGQPPNGQFTINRHSPQARGLVGWWPTVNQKSNSIIDYSGLNHPATINSANTVYTAAGGGMVDYNDAGYSAVSSSVPVFTVGAVCIWFYMPSTIGIWSEMLVTRDGTGNTNWEINAARGDKRSIYYGYNGAIQLDPGGVDDYALRAFNHCVVTIGSSGGYIYINGVQTVYDAGVTSWLAGASDIEIGRRANGDDNNCSGYIGDVRFYNRFLSANEVRHLYNPDTRWDLYQPVAPSRYWLLPQAAPAAAGRAQINPVKGPMFRRGPI